MTHMIENLKHFRKTNPLKYTHEECKEFHRKFGVCLKKVAHKYRL